MSEVGLCWNRYPGGKFFDPFGFSRGDSAKLEEYKLKEVKNGRLAILVSPHTRLLLLRSMKLASFPCVAWQPKYRQWGHQSGYWKLRLVKAILLLGVI